MNTYTRSEQGFTLIEVLAALLIFSLSIVGLTHAGSQSVRVASYLDQKVLAGIVADNQLIIARASAEFSTGDESGAEEQMGQKFSYRVVTQSTLMPELLKVTVTVTQGEIKPLTRGKDSATPSVLSSRTAFRTRK